MRSPFKKNIEQVPVEDAHGGSGSRKLLLSKSDSVSSHLQAMTKGFLPPGGVWDWHKHEAIDEYFVVLKGRSRIEYRDGSSMDCQVDDLIYIPSEIEHRITNLGTEVAEFYFVRLNAGAQN